MQVQPGECLPNTVRNMHKMIKEEVPSDKNYPYELKLLLNLFRYKKIYYYVKILIVILYIFGLLYSMRGKYLIFSQITQFKTNIVTFVHILGDFILFTINTYGIISITSTRTSFLEELFSFIFGRSFVMKKTHKSLKPCVIIIRLITFLPIATTVYFIGCQIGWGIYQFFVFTDIWFYCLCFMVCTAVFVSDKVRENFTTLNDSLEELNTKNSIPFITTCITQELHLNMPQSLNSRSHVVKLRNLMNNYNYLSDLLDELNSHMKTTLVMMIMCPTVNILCSLTTIIECALALGILINGIDMITRTIVIQSMLVLACMVSKLSSFFNTMLLNRHPLTV